MIASDIIGRKDIPMRSKTEQAAKGHGCIK